MCQSEGLLCLAEGMERAASEQQQWMEQCAQLKAEVQVSQQASTALQELLGEMERKEKGMAEQVEALQGQMAALEMERQRLELEVEGRGQQQGLLSQAQAQVEGLQTEVEHLRQAMEDKEGMVQQLQEASEALQAKVAVLEAERDQQQMQRQELDRGPSLACLATFRGLG